MRRVVSVFRSDEKVSLLLRRDATVLAEVEELLLIADVDRGKPTGLEGRHRRRRALAIAMPG